MYGSSPCVKDEVNGLERFLIVFFKTKTYVTTTDNQNKVDITNSN